MLRLEGVDGGVLPSSSLLMADVSYFDFIKFRGGWQVRACYMRELGNYPNKLRQI